MLFRLDRRISEQRFIQEFGIRALERGAEARLTVHGLAVTDVLDLLSVEELAPAAGSRLWARLRADPQAPRGSGAFKEWAQRHVGLRVDDEAIRAAARSLDRIPDGLALLAEILGDRASLPDERGWQRRDIQP